MKILEKDIIISVQKTLSSLNFCRNCLAFPLVSLGQTWMQHFLKLNLPFPLLHTNNSPAFVAVSLEGATLYQVAVAMRSHP